MALTSMQNSSPESLKRKFEKSLGKKMKSATKNWVLFKYLVYQWCEHFQVENEYLSWPQYSLMITIPNYNVFLYLKQYLMLKISCILSLN